MKVLELKKGDFQSFRKEVLKHLGEELKITYNGKYILWTFSRFIQTSLNIKTYILLTYLISDSRSVSGIIWL